MARPRKVTPSTAASLAPSLRSRLLAMARDDGARAALADTLDGLARRGGVHFERVAEALYSAQARPSSGGGALSLFGSERLSRWTVRRVLRLVDVIALLDELPPESAAVTKVVPDAATGAYVD